MVELDGDPKQSPTNVSTVDLSPLGKLGSKMNGIIKATGLYDADLKYIDFAGAPGALTVKTKYLAYAVRNSHIEFTYYPNGRNQPGENLNLTPDQASVYMRTVGLTTEEVAGKKIATDDEKYYDETLEEFLAV